MRPLRALFIFVLAVMLSSSSVLSQAPKETTPQKEAPKPTTPAAPVATHTLTPDDVGAFIDGIVPVELQRENIAGAVVSVVKDGQIIFERGYGYSDVQKKTPVSPTDTLFRPGSISKLFTWTAVMQLVEQGKIDLGRNVNDYIDFKIPDTFPQPITMRNLMTHTPGFEEVVKDLISDQPSHLMSLEQYVKTHVPRRIYPPGKVPAYSNYGAALAGYIVQRVSGMPFEQYVEQNILTPLDMPHSTFRQPLPPQLDPLMSRGYKLASDDKPRDFELVIAAPAGSMSTSAHDMAHFAIAHLQDGRHENTQILKPETEQMMQARQLTMNPEMNGMALGFYESSRNGLRIIGHGGDSQWFHSELFLIPSEHLGLFVSMNSAGSGETNPRSMLWRQFLDRYYPYQAPAAVKPANAVEDANAVAGSYITSRGCDTCILRIASLFGQAKITAGKDGTITSDAMKYPSGQPMKFEEIARFVFRDVNGQNKLAFNRQPDGSFQLVVPFFVVVFGHAPWYWNGTFLLVLTIYVIAILILTLLSWPIAAMVRHHFGQQMTPDPALRALRVLTKFACMLDLIVLAGWGVFFMRGSEDLNVFSGQNDGWLHLLQILTVVALIGTVVPLLSAVRSLRESSQAWWAKVADVSILLAGLGFVYFVLIDHFLDWSLRY